MFRESKNDYGSIEHHLELTTGFLPPYFFIRYSALEKNIGISQGLSIGNYTFRKIMVTAGSLMLFFVSLCCQ